MDKTIQILEWIDVLERRPLMILSDKGFLSLKAYVEGYIDGLGLAYGVPKLNQFISRWFGKKTSKQANVLWTNQIVYSNDMPDEELKIIMLQTLRNFFKENPEWHKVNYWSTE